MDEQPTMNTSDVSTTTLEAQCAEYLAGWKRAQADYQNLKKDNERERLDMTKFANERLLRDLLPAVDQLAVAMQFVPATQSLPDEARKQWENWLVGMRAVWQLWQQLAERIGLTMIETNGEFDPNKHEAVGEEAVDSGVAGRIVRAVQPGWLWHDQVLRPAQVIVATDQKST